MGISQNKGWNSKALEKLNLAAARKALVIPQPGHGKPVIFRMGHKPRWSNHSSNILVTYLSQAHPKTCLNRTVK